jgi:deoxycytidylate deaminase
MNKYEINWSDIAFGSKKPIKDLKPIFIAPSREISLARFTQLLKEYLPVGNIVVGCAMEDYIDGFEGQLQFKTLKSDTIRPIIGKVNSSPSPHKVLILKCRQADVVNIYEKIRFKKALLVNGSWRYSFHTRAEFYHLVANSIPFEYISPFASEDEAKKYAEDFKPQSFKSGRLFTEKELLEIAKTAAKNSFANEFQTGLTLAKKRGDKYELIATSYNQVVPYQSFAWHYGALRERYMSPQGDLNFYDTVHAEINMIINAQKSHLSLKGASLFINLLPCPHCARALCETDLAELVYSLDHSDGYAVALLEKSGKKVRRLIDNEKILKEEG